MTKTSSVQEQKTWLERVDAILTLLTKLIAVLAGLIGLAKVSHIDQWLVQLLQNKQAVRSLLNHLSIGVALFNLFMVQIFVSIEACAYLIRRVLFKGKAWSFPLFCRLILYFGMLLWAFYNLRHPLGS